MTKYRSLEQWNEPESAGGKRHEKGEVLEIDPKVIFDLDDLLRGGTLTLDLPAPVDVQEGGVRVPAALPVEQLPKIAPAPILAPDLTRPVPPRGGNS